jgi:aspartate kinase
MQNSAISFIVCLDNEPQKIEQLMYHLNVNYNLTIKEGLELITISNYSENSLKELLSGKSILIEQKTEKNIQVVI